MALDWTCSDKLVALAFGTIGLTIGDPGLIAGSAIGGAGLMGAWKKARADKGFNSEALLNKTRTEVRRGYEDWAHGRSFDEADVRAADLAMEKHLADCVPTAEELAKITFTDSDYAQIAAEVVVERLATKNSIFAAGPVSGANLTAREFALVTITKALTVAKANEAFLNRLANETTLLLGPYLTRIEAKVDAGFAGQDRRFDRLEAMLSEKLGIPIEVIAREIAAILEQTPAATEGELYADLRRFKAKHDRLLARVAQIETFDNRLMAIKSEAKEALDRYDHARAAALYGRARALIDQRTAELARQGAEFAQAEAVAWILEKNWQAAADVWADAASKLAPFDAKAAGEVGNFAGTMLLEFGAQYGGDALDAAVTAYRQALEINRRDKLPVEWAGTQNNLGLALRAKGERQVEMALFGESVSAYRASLEVFTRDQMPEAWATTQNNLGNMLARQGELLGGKEGMRLLDEAVVAYGGALEVQTGDAMLVQRAITQSNLGNVLVSRGEWLESKRGIELFTKAISAYRASLQVYARNHMYLDWAMTQNNLGKTLLRLGERLDGSEGIGLLGEAVVACRAALTVLPRDRLPVHWGTTKHNLGTALASQGERLGGPEGIRLLGEAITAYRAALEVRSSKQMRIDCAMTHENIALAFESLAKLDTAQLCIYLRAATMEFRAALDLFAPKHMRFNFEKAQAGLTRVEAKFAEHCSEDRGSRLQ